MRILREMYLRLDTQSIYMLTQTAIITEAVKLINRIRIRVSGDYRKISSACALKETGYKPDDILL